VFSSPHSIQIGYCIMDLLRNWLAGSKARLAA
jgi:hypothetical protein